MNNEETHGYYAEVLKDMSDRQVQDLSSALKEKSFLFTIRYSVSRERLPITIYPKEGDKDRYYQLCVESEEGLVALCEEVSIRGANKPSNPNVSRSGCSLKERVGSLYERFTELFLTTSPSLEN